MRVIATMGALHRFVREYAQAVTWMRGPVGFAMASTATDALRYNIKTIWSKERT